MRTKFVFVLGLLALTSVLLPGCEGMNAAQQAPSAELPEAPVLPSYIRLSPTAPPSPQDEIVPTIDDLQHKVWKPGYWSYEENQFTWVPGEIIPKPAFTAVWVPDHWEKREYGWAFVAGYWQ